VKRINYLLCALGMGFLLVQGHDSLVYGKTVVVFELQEGENGHAIGYAVWPNLTYMLP
jgi:hypothetical protein